MTGFTFPRLVILLPALLLCFSGSASAFRATSVVREPVAAQDPKKGTAIVPRQVDRVVINVVIDKIEDGRIYTKDGRAIQISGVKVVDNSTLGSIMKMAELAYEGSTLVSVIIK